MRWMLEVLGVRFFSYRTGGPEARAGPCPAPAEACAGAQWRPGWMASAGLHGAGRPGERRGLAHLLQVS